jgi:hypothetical protein
MSALPPKADILSVEIECPLCAISGHWDDHHAGLLVSFCGLGTPDSDLSHCTKLVEQVSGVSEIHGIEAFGKPGIDVVQELAGIAARNSNDFACWRRAISSAL